MKKEKAKILSHTFKGVRDGSYTYEITFNQSLEYTCRMNAMTDGLDRFDRWRKFWALFHSLVARPMLIITDAKWAAKFEHWAYKKF